MRNPAMKSIEAYVRRLDPSFQRHDSTFEFMVIALVAAAITGPDVDAIIAFTGYLRGEVERTANQLIAAGLWQDGVVITDAELLAGHP